MSISIRQGRPDDAGECGRICYEAFAAIAGAHNFAPDIPSVDAATGLIGALLSNASFHGVVAEENGRIVGSNFLDERAAIFGIGPITVDPKAQNKGVGRRLMSAVIERAQAKGTPGVRLVQAGYHCRSLSLYTKLGFAVREHLSCLNGPAIGERIAGLSVRPASERDLEACNRLSLRVHGHDRAGELSGAIASGAANIVERNGRIAGYATELGFFGHAVAETNDDLKALVGAAQSFAGPGFLAPSRNSELLRWCLAKGLRITQPLTLMTIGLYNEPAGAYLPSILY